MEKNRKYIVLTILVAMVAVAGYLNLSYNQPGEQNAVETQGSGALGEATLVNGEPVKNDGLAQAKETKDSARSRAMEMLNTIINDSATDKESREKASAELISMADNMEAEGVIEGTLKTKGFGECVAFITNGTANIAVKSEKPLAAADVAKIQDAVKSAGKVAGDKITITQVK